MLPYFVKAAGSQKRQKRPEKETEAGSMCYFGQQGERIDQPFINHRQQVLITCSAA